MTQNNLLKEHSYCNNQLFGRWAWAYDFFTIWELVLLAK